MVVWYTVTMHLYSEWVKEYELGVSTPEIGRKYGVSGGLVWNHIHKLTQTRDRAETKMAENNPMWKGNDISYAQLHRWVETRLIKPLQCPKCFREKPLDLSNISNVYDPNTYTRELKNWKWLCRRCHMIEDGRMNKLNRKGTKPKHTECKLCGKPHEARGLCKNHYQNIRRAERIKERS